MISKKIVFKLVWLISLLLILPIKSHAEELTIGQTLTVYLNPSIPSGGWITSADWSTDVIGLNCFNGGTWGTGLKVDGYWSDNATLSCDYTYSYYDFRGDIQVGHNSEYWLYTCKGYPVSISPTSITLDKGEKATLTFTISGAKLGTLAARWVSSDTKVASVYADGDYSAVVTAKYPGTTVITCYSYMGEPVECLVSVNSYPPTGISISPSEVEVLEGKSVQLTSKLTPDGASATRTWHSDNTSIATVQNGRVTGISEGKTKIWVSTDNGLSAYSEVTVRGKFHNPRGPVSSALSGDGTIESPYIIASAADLRLLSDKVNSGTSFQGNYFRQTEDITINSGSHDSEDFKTQELWIPIGKNKLYSFNGNYDGDNHTFSGMFIVDNNELYENFTGFGLFGYTINANLQNIIINNTLIETSYSWIAAIVGYAMSSSKVDNCHVFNSIIKGSFVAGVVGYTKGRVQNCSNSATVISIFRGSGITGESFSSIYNCINTGNIQGHTSASGITTFSSSSIHNCCNSGNIQSEIEYATGIVGTVKPINSKSGIYNCVNYGSLTAISDPSATAAILYKNNSSYYYDTKYNYYLNDYSCVNNTKRINLYKNHSLDESEMKSLETVQALNEADDPLYSEWVAGEDGFPVFDWFKELLAGVEDCVVGDNSNVIDFSTLSEKTPISVYSLSGVCLYKGIKGNMPEFVNDMIIVVSPYKTFKLRRYTH